MEKLTSAEIKELDSATFKARLKRLDVEFSRINLELLTPLAVEISKMKANCHHRNSEARPHARFCNDCGEYYAIKTAFSPEVEAWFLEQNKLVQGS